jgi:lipopolysaccharide/colanic/teichoic acid biosynthesis glycosyltransferase
MIYTVSNLTSRSQLPTPPSTYSLHWRQQMLLVKLDNQKKYRFLSQTPERLTDCLQFSPVHLVKLDPALDEAMLVSWANACQQSGKAAFLSLPSASELPHKRAKLTWMLKCLVDRVAAALLLLLLSPLMIGLALLIWTRSPGPIFFRQWRVGKRGKLFQIFKFRTMFVGAEQFHHQVMQHQTGLHKLTNDPRLMPLARWLRRYSLDELPQLINVLRGEMSLVGPRPWAMYDAVRVSPSMLHRLNALPGMTGMWQVEMRSHLRDIDAVNRCDLDYLRTWSPLQDLKILLLTIPRVLTGFGAY